MSTTENLKASTPVLLHRWIIHYGNERGESWHHMTAFDHEVREIAAKALEMGMISLTVLRTTNPLPPSNSSATGREQT